MVDTCCSKMSIDGKDNYMVYCSLLGCEVEIDGSRATVCYVETGSKTSQGVAKIEFPMDKMWFSFDDHIVNGDVSILLAINDMNPIEAYLSSLRDELVYEANRLVARVSRFTDIRSFSGMHTFSASLRRWI